MNFDERGMGDPLGTGIDDDDVATLTSDMLINLVAVMIAMIGGMAMLPEARVAEQGAPDPGAAPLVVHVTERGRVRLEAPDADAIDLDAYAEALAVRVEADSTHSLPVVVCLPDTIPSGHLIDILNVSAGVPGVTASLGSSGHPDDTRAAADRSLNP